MSYMAKKAVKSRKSVETDSVYFLKIVLFVILGSTWLRIHSGGSSELPIPVGLLIGIIFASHDHFQVDRKIEYALLLVAAFIGFWLPMGINVIL